MDEWSGLHILRTFFYCISASWYVSSRCVSFPACCEFFLHCFYEVTIVHSQRLLLGNLKPSLILFCKSFQVVVNLVTELVCVQFGPIRMVPLCHRCCLTLGAIPAVMRGHVLRKVSAWCAHHARHVLDFSFPPSSPPPPLYTILCYYMYILFIENL